MDGTGKVVIEFRGQDVDLSGLQVLRLRFPARQDLKAVVVAWRSDLSNGQVLSWRVDGPPAADFWVDMSQVGGWGGKANKLAFAFLGPLGTELRLESVELLPRSAMQIFRVTMADWLTFTPWRHSSINTHIGVSNPAKYPYPVYAAAAVVTAGTLSYLLACGLRRRRIDWRVPIALFFVGWLGLDALWQHKLVRQNEESKRSFAGKSSHEKRLASDDGALYKFVLEARKAIDQPDARIFVASEDDFTGMRGAYFAYPSNVYWERHATTLPASEHIRKGDYVIMLRPIRAGFDKDSGLLRYGEGMSLTTRLLMSNQIGAVFEVK
ncbi:MAG: hypothetical protein Cons2KO_10340 [Congregibacter sp.]